MVIEVSLNFSLSFTAVLSHPPPHLLLVPPTTLPIPQETPSPLTRGVVFRSTRIHTHARVPTSIRIYQRAAYSSRTVMIS
ncbi:hypothetical protein C8Q75DRAFT_790199 [Abortiporus biennis]|nr:hypothetical protein C8Q75DRAFT_790199 [Abortiporus biennis]